MFPLLARRRSGSGDKSPLSLPGDDRGVLCLHGFTGTPFEIRPVAEALAGFGFTVEAPLLAGHGVDVRTLAATGWPDWLASAQRAFETLASRTGRRVAVVGFSMGGLLALRLARLYPDRVAAVIVMSTPIRLRAAQVRGIRLLCRVPVALRIGPVGEIPKLSGSDVSDPDMRAANPGLPAMPLSGLESLLGLMAEVRGDLPAVRAPALVVHGRQDHTVPMEDSLEITGSLGSAVVERLWLDRSFHLVGIDVERHQVIEGTTRFLARHATW